ncbi:hypothetical protein RQP46_003384 [Phenoliferia psychrophenolica]
MESLISTTALTLLVASTTALLLAWLASSSSHRDGRAIGTSPLRDDLWSPLESRFLTGNLGAQMKNVHRMPEFRLELIQGAPKGKRATFTGPFRRIILVSTPEEMEYIQHTNFKNYEKGKATHDRGWPLGNGIFVSDGEQWIVQRKATSRIFTATAFRGLITDSVTSTLSKLQSRLSDLAKTPDVPFDLSPLFFAFTLDSFSLLAFGQAVGALSQSEPVPFATAFDFVQSGIARNFVNPAWKITDLFSEQGRRMRAEVKVIDEFVYNIIDSREKKKSSDGEEHEEEKTREDLLTLYTRLRMEDGSKLSRVGLRDAVLNLLIAGRDTTAQNLSWVSFHLLARPDLLAKARLEIDNLPPVTYDSFKSMVYLNALFNEGVRLHPAVPNSGWTAKGPDKLPGGPRIEAGDVVGWSDYAFGRLTSIWGEDAAAFDPERWIAEDGSLKTASSWKLHGFNGGYRLCLGKTLATFEAISVLALVIENFDLSLAPGYLQNVEKASDGKTPMYSVSLTHPMKHPLMVQARLRKRG